MIWMVDGCKLAEKNFERGSTLMRGVDNDSLLPVAQPFRKSPRASYGKVKFLSCRIPNLTLSTHYHHHRFLRPCPGHTSLKACSQIFHTHKTERGIEIQSRFNGSKNMKSLLRSRRICLGKLQSSLCELIKALGLSRFLL